LTKRLARYTKVFELGARLGTNSLLAAVALMALSRLAPHLQTQADQLAAVNQTLDRLETSTSRLQSDFGRYFDPWQAENIMQEQSGYRPPSERQVVWTKDQDAAATSANEATAAEDAEQQTQDEVQSDSNPMAKPSTREAAPAPIDP
jgi:TolA-binding protein